MEESKQEEAILSNVERFAHKHLELLELEKEEEIEENKNLLENSSLKGLQKKGVCIPKLHISSTSTGLFGRSVLNLESAWGKNPLPTHTISSGDIVGIANCNSDGNIKVITSGVVSRVSETTISIAFEKNADFSDLEDNEQYIVIKVANDVTYKRLKRCLKNLQSKSRDYNIVDVLFGEKEPKELEETTAFNSLSYFNNNLNDEQREAVTFALKQKELAIIHGPPGTGKTTTVVECIMQSVHQKLKVLACAPSNIAVDNLVEKLSAHKIKMVRLGHPARFLTNIQQYSLDAIVSCYDGSNVVEELRKEIDKLRANIGKKKGAGNRKAMWAENRSMIKEVKNREKNIVKHVLTNADVVLCTLTSGSDDGPLKYVDEGHFDVCFVDECSQSIEAACWIPLVLVKKCILAGDHHQLPPTIVSKKAAKSGLERTLMERLLELYGDGIKRMLTMQYRMHQDIMQWPSDKLYDGKLVAHASVKSHLLSDLPGVSHDDDTSIPLLLIDTNGYGLHEMDAEDSESKGNEGEADLVAAHVRNLVRAGLDPSDVAVVTPYNLQVDLVKARLAGKYPKLEIKSVDGFQGREKEAIVLSLVRSNEKGEVGFLSEDRRINVAITRARRHVAVICDTVTVSHHDFLKSLATYIESRGEVRSAFQYAEEIGNYPSVRRSEGLLKEKKKSGGAGGTAKSGAANRSGGRDSSVRASKFASWKGVEKKIPLRSEEEKRCTEAKYEVPIKEFMKSDEVSLKFPSSLSSFDRRVIHEICEKLGLLHISTGEGADRCIEVKKHAQQSSSTIASNPSSSKEIDNPTSKELVYLTSKPTTSSSCSKIVKNLEAASSVISSTNGSQPQGTKNKTQPKSKPVKPSPEPDPKPKTKQQPKLKTLQLKESGDPDVDDFDTLIDQVVKADRTCSYLGCKQCVATLCQTCQFCKGRFCYSHFMPEIHGCGDAVRVHARKQISKDGVLYAGSGRPQKKVDPVKQAYLKKKLDKKIGDMTEKRKQQQKKS